MLVNQLCMLYTHKSCPIDGKLARSPMEGKTKHENHEYGKHGKYS